jgi:sec-independent protein translocase protein TatC
MPPKIAEQKEMPITGHLAELRQRLIKCLIALGIGFGVSFYFVDGLLALLKRPSPAELYFFSPTEAFWISLEIAFFAGLFLSLPVILYQLWKFIGPGLFSHERKHVVPFMFLGMLFFTFGLLFCYFIVLPFALTFLMGYGAEMGLKPLLSIGSYIDFLLKFLLAFGLVFELPLAITLLARMGLMTPEFLSRNRKYAILLNAIAAAILTPTSDVFNMMLMMVPLLLFYELGILGAKLFGRKRSAAAVMESEVGGKALMLALAILASLLGSGRSPALAAEVTEPFRYIQSRPRYQPPADQAVTLYRTNGPGGYTGIQSIAIGKDNTIYVGTYGLGVYKNRKEERDWQPLTRGLKDYYIHSIFVDSDQTLYAGTIRQGAFKSIDGGEHWVQINSGLPDTEVEVITMGPQRFLYAGTGSGVFISRDQGKSWTALNDGIRQVLVRTIAFGKDNAIYIGSAGMGAYRSLDQGKSWQQIHQGMVEGDVYPEDFIRTMVMSRNGTLYAGTFDGGIFASQDGGSRWKPLNKGLTNTSIRSVLSGSNGLLYIGTGKGVFLSRDGGDHWTSISQGQEDVNVQTMALGPDDTVYVGTDIGLYATRDQGRRWEFLSQNLTTPIVKTILVGPDRDLYAASQGLGVLRSQDSGRSWGFAKEGLQDDFIQALVQDPSGVLYAGTENGVFKSTDKGKSWTAMNEGLPGSGGLTVHRMLHHRHGFFVVTDAGLFRWEPDKNRWVSLEAAKFSGKKIHALVVDNEKTVYLGTEEGLFKQEEGGSSWAAMEFQPGGPSNGASSVPSALLWTEEHGLFAAGPRGLFLGKRQDKQTLTWQAKNNGLPSNGIVRVLAQDRQRPSLLYAGTSRGLFVSRNGGDQWEPARIAGEDAGLLDIRSVEVQPDGILFVGTSDAGVLVGINRLSPL